MEVGEATAWCSCSWCISAKSKGVARAARRAAARVKATSDAEAAAQVEATTKAEAAANAGSRAAAIGGRWRFLGYMMGKCDAASPQEKQHQQRSRTRRRKKKKK